MKSIQLHTAALDNSGIRREAGETLAVGDGDDMIDAVRAGVAVGNGGAVVVPATTKATDK